MPSFATRTAGFLSIAVLALSSAGCGGDNDASESGTSQPSASTPTASPSESVTPTTQTSSTPTPTRKRLTRACDLLSPETATLALGGTIELDMDGAGPVMQGVDACQYHLAGGAISTHVSLSVVSPSSELFEGFSAPPTTCGFTSAAPMPAEDIAPGAYRCLLISSYDGYAIQDTVQWAERGKVFYLYINADGDDSLPEDAGVNVARKIRSNL